MIGSALRTSVILSALSGPSFGNSVIEFDQESGMFLGRGYDTVAGTVKGDCVARTEPEVPGDSNAVRTRFSISRAESYSSLARSTGLSASASFAGGTFSASGKASFLQSISINDYSLYVLAQVQVDNATKVMLDPELTVKAFDYLRDNGPEAFYRRCGDSFISGYTTGGELFSIIEIKTNSQEEKNQRSAELGGSFGVFSASGEFSEAIKKISQESNVNVFVYRTGAAAVVKVTPEEMISEAVEFPTKVSGTSAYIYKATVTPYTNVPLPPDKEPIDILNAQEVTEKLSEYRLQAYQNLANLEYVVANPIEFVEPDIVSLSNSAAEVRQDINEIVKAARICTRSLENCTFPESLTLTVVTLPKRVDASTVSVAERKAEEERLRNEAEKRMADAEAELQRLKVKLAADAVEMARLKAEADRKQKEADKAREDARKADEDRKKADEERKKAEAEAEAEAAVRRAMDEAIRAIKGPLGF